MRPERLLNISSLSGKRERARYLLTSEPKQVNEAERVALLATIIALHKQFTAAAIQAGRQGQPTHASLSKWHGLMLGGQVHAKRVARLGAKPGGIVEKRIAHDIPKQLAAPRFDDVAAIVKAATEAAAAFKALAADLASK